MPDKLNLGRALDISRQLAAPGGPVVRDNLSPGQSGIPPRPRPQGAQRMIEGQRIQVELRPADGSIDIGELGLRQAYAIFGLPGTGKTVLIKHVLLQLLQMHGNKRRAELRPGGLILDPKGVLRTELDPLFQLARRKDDIAVINRSVLEADGAFFNPIPNGLTDFELASYLAKTAAALGATTTEPYWQIVVEGVILAVLIAFRNNESRRPTLRELAETCLALAGDATEAAVPAKSPAEGGRLAEQLAKLKRDDTANRKLNDRTRLHELLDHMDANRRAVPQQRQSIEGDLDIARSWLSTHLKSDKRHVVDGLLSKAFGSFRSRSYRCFSPPDAAGLETLSPYEEIIENGRILLVSADSAEDLGGQMICMLAKLFFQDAVKRRDLLIAQKRITNRERLTFLIADEYSDVAVALAGDSTFGDAHFFQNMRQFKCFALVATQSLEGLSSGRLKDVYKMLLGTMSAKIFFRLGDETTMKWLSELAGQDEILYRFDALTVGGQSREELRERPAVPDALIRGLPRFRAIAVGSLDGYASGRNIQCFEVPLKPLQPN